MDEGRNPNQNSSAVMMQSVADISNVQCSSNVGSHNLDHDEIFRRGCLMSHRSYHRQICVQVNAVLESVDFEVAWWWFVGIKSIHNLMVYGLEYESKLWSRSPTDQRHAA